MSPFNRITVPVALLFAGAALAQQPPPTAAESQVPVAAGWVAHEYADQAGVPLKSVETFLNETCQPSGLDGIQILTLQKGHNETMNFHLYCRQDRADGVQYRVTQLPISNHQLDAAVNPVAGRPNIRLAAFYFGKSGDQDYFVVIEKLAAGTSSEPVRLTEGTDPGALPGDFMDIPQSAQLKVPLGDPAVTHSTRSLPLDATLSPGFALALEASQVAMATCEAQGYRVAVAVTDAAGKLKVSLAPDGVANNRVYMALRKDVTVVGFKMSTLALRRKIEADPSLLGQVKPNMVLLPGGMPIMKGDVLVGAIAVSGATAYVEENCAQAGLRRIQSRL